MKFYALHWPEIIKNRKKSQKKNLKARPEIQQHAAGKATLPLK